MNTKNYEQNTVEQVMEHIAEAGHVLHSNNIDTTTNHHLLLSQAAEAVSARTDEVLAIIDYRTRWAAQHAK